MRVGIITILITLAASVAALADRASFLELARQGWNYELRTNSPGRDNSIPVHINGRDMAGVSLCLVGDRPHDASLRVLNAFRALIRHTYETPVTMRYAGQTADQCGSGRTVILRLYSGFPPNQALSDDLEWLNRVHLLGLPLGRFHAATSPAMAQTFFGHRGQGTHIMVKQSALPHLGPLERAFYRSILIEELFQSFTFGMDVMLFDRSSGFESKLQETPFNLHRLSWESRDFMRGLLRSNPGALCVFDIFMLHAIADAPVDQTLEPAFLTYIDREYDHLLARANATVADPRFAGIVSPDCSAQAE